ncbi:MAG: hypothetical protein JJU19_04460 [Pararhodobacter sp.]|nr:hypothetical protein [Pararhodobacter sp.]
MTYHPRDKAPAVTVGTHAERKAYVQEWIAKRQKVAAGSLIATAALVLPLVAEAQSGQGFVDASTIAGVRSATILDDGSAQLVLNDGRTVMVGARDVRTGPDGSVQISNAAAELVVDVIGADVGAAGGDFGGAAIAAGVVGLGVAAAAASSSSSSDDSGPAPRPDPEPVTLGAADLQSATRVSELFGVRPSEQATSLTVTYGEGDAAIEVAAVLGADGVWRVPGQSAAAFAETQGEQPIRFVALNDEGEEVDSGTNTATIDTVPPTISIDTPIAGDGVLNAQERGEGLTIEGDTTAEDGQAVTVTINGVDFTATAEGGRWSVDLSAEELADLDLPDGASIDVAANVSDAAGNPAATATQSFDTDFTAEVMISTPIAGGELSSIDTFSDLEITGTSNGIEADRTVTVTFAGTNYTGTIGADGTWSVTVPQADLAAIDSETTSIEVSATATDAAGNASTATVDLPADLSMIPVTITAPAADTTIDAGMAAAGLDVSGTASPDALVTVTLEGVEKSATAGADGSWSVSFDPEEIPADGSYSISASATLDGNPVGDASVGIAVDTAPAITLTRPADGTVVDLEAAEGSLRVSGTTNNIADDEPVTIVLQNSDGEAVATRNTTVSEGSFTASFGSGTLSALADESDFNIVVTASGVTAQLGISTDFQPTISVELPESGIIDATTLDPADESVGGMTRGIEEGQLVTVTIDDFSGNVIFTGTGPVAADGSFDIPISADAVNALQPGTGYRITADATNEAGRAAETFEGSVLIYGEASTYIATVDNGDGTVGVQIFIDPRETMPDDRGISLNETITFDPAQGSFVAGSVTAATGALGVPNTANAGDGELLFSLIGLGLTMPGWNETTDPLQSFNLQILDTDNVIRIDGSAPGDGAYASFIGTAGDDMISAPAGIDSVIRGGGGNDAIDLSAPGVHSVLFEAAPDENGFDTVTGFSLGGALADRLGIATDADDRAELRGNGSDFQITDGGALGANVALLVFTTALADLDLQTRADVLLDGVVSGLEEDDIIYFLVGDGTDAILSTVLADEVNNGDVEDLSVADIARFEGIGDMSGFSAANILGFEAHTT